MEIVILAVILGCIPGAIAQSKGRSFVGWWIFGALLFIVALPASLIVKPIAAEPARGAAPARPQPSRAANPQFIADGAYGGVPYMVRPDNTVVTRVDGSEVAFRTMDAFKAMVDQRAR